MNPNTDKLVRRTTMVATATASYFLLTADYGPEPNALDPVWFVYVFIFVVLIPTLHVSYMLKVVNLENSTHSD